MRKVLVVTIIALLANNVFAVCPTPPTSNQWNVSYSQDQSCWTSTGSATVTNSTISCFYAPSWIFGSGNGGRRVSYTIQPNDPIYNANKFTTGFWADLASPSATRYDWLEVDVQVTHPNNTVNSYLIYYWNGTYGSVSSCTLLPPSNVFYTANTGDKITVIVGMGNSGNATINVSVPSISDSF
jgi:hypothetical protein